MLVSRSAVFLQQKSLFNNPLPVMCGNGKAQPHYKPYTQNPSTTINHKTQPKLPPTHGETVPRSATQSLNLTNKPHNLFRFHCLHWTKQSQHHYRSGYFNSYTTIHSRKPCNRRGNVSTQTQNICSQNIWTNCHPNTPQPLRATQQKSAQAARRDSSIHLHNNFHFAQITSSTISTVLSLIFGIITNAALAMAIKHIKNKQFVIQKQHPTKHKKHSNRNRNKNLSPPHNIRHHQLTFGQKIKYSTHKPTINRFLCYFAAEISATRQHITEPSYPHLPTTVQQ